MLINLDNGIQKIIPYKDYIKAHELWMFNPACCNFCCDSLGGLSDISFGDAWNVKNEFQAEHGISLCIARTPLANTILKEAICKSALKIKEVERDFILNSQGLTSSRRTKYSKVNMKFNKKYTKYKKRGLNDDTFNPGSFDYAKYILFNINRRILSKKSIWSVSRVVLNLEEEFLRMAIQK
jgi:coenzyme F420-reducing hydrogenase beta subunit